MSKKMLINASHPEENRVAIVVDGVLSELDIEIAGQEQTKGNIYKAAVVRVESGLQAAFVDYGAVKLGFLQIGEIHPKLLPNNDDGKGRARINDILHRGQEILVQIVKEERGNKGAALTTNLSVPGRYMVLMPDSTTKGVSRKIQDDPERKKLKRTMAELDLPERMGYIVRTAGIGKEKEELRRDFDYLVRLFEGILSRKDQVKAPAQLYQESNLVIRSIRDYFSTEMDEVLIDDQKVYQETKDFFALVMPELTHLVKQHRERRPVFSRYQIEEQIDGLAKNQIPLPSGGSIVIDQTEALVAIDVNSGKMSSESGIEATAAKTNLEAATEVGRQLRLRDLGGLVVIDFIDMRDRKKIREVEQELRKSLKDDKAKVTVGRISQFGLMEMSRQRLKPTLSVGSYLDCPHCLGKGRIKSAENQAVALLRQIHAAASKGHIGHIEARVPIDVANNLINSKRQSLVELEKRLNLKVSIIGRSDMTPGQLDIELHKREKNDEDSREIAPVSHANQIENALAAALQEVSAEETSDETPLEDNEAPTAAAQTTEQASEVEQGERKSRRRRRRRRRKGDSPTDVGAEQVSPENAAIEGLSEAAEQSTPEKQATAVERVTEKTESQTAAESISTEQPKRRRTRRPAAKKTAEQQETTSAATEESKKTSAEAVPAEEKPKRRSRRPARKPVAATEATETKTGDNPQSGQLVSENTAEETPASTGQAKHEEPKRRTRRTPKKAAEEAQPELAVVPAEVAIAEEKPKRRPSRPRKNPVAEAPAEATAASTDTAAEEKPKRRTRRTTQKPTGETPVKPKTESTEAKPKPRTRRTIKKVAAEPTTENVETVLSEEKPKRRPGRPRKTVKPAEAGQE